MTRSALKTFMATVVLLPAFAAASAPPLFLPLEGAVPPGLATAASQRIAVDRELLEIAPGALRLDLPGGRSVAAQLTDFEVRPGGVTWRGTPVEEAGGSVTLTLERGWLRGLILVGNESWEVRTLADGGQAVDRLDSRRFPACATPATTGSTLPLGGDPDPCPDPDDPVDRVDLLGMYTPQARDAAGGAAQVEALIQAAVDISNTAFVNSEMPIRFNLVGTALANRDDSGNIGADLNWLRNDPTTAALRDTLNADLVSLIVDNGGGFCGVGQLPLNWGPGGSPTSAFQVTADGCAVGNLTFAHEHGHNMGLEHDPANGNPPGNGTFPTRYGHYQDGLYRTVMSYSNQCTEECPRVPQWSNPEVLFMGLPTGIADERDNRRASAGTDGCVTDYRFGGGLFSDGFESGDTSQWSTTVP